MADMKFKFTEQDYQTEAVEAVAEVFGGQGYNDNSRYRRDVRIERDLTNLNMSDDELTVGFANAKIQLSDDDLLLNIRRIQNNGNIVQSESLVTSGLGRCALDVEMETGTGKTYVYIKTMFELNKRYGWSKFIVVVPSIAIREGVKKSFDTTQEHFMEKYGKKARYFIYDSSNLSQIDGFSQSADINVMIINIQAFNATGKDARRIYMELDEFQSRRPIDVIAANRPILILDEPQKMGGDATRESLKKFKPLFCLYYSATHKEHHNTVYVLDAVDAYNRKLVKRIFVKGIDVHNLSGTSGYMYLDKIVLDPHKPPRARMEIEVSRAGGIKRETRLLSVGDDLYSLSNNLNQYKNCRITEIDFSGGYVAFTNGEKIYTSTVSGDETEKYVRRIQIRETIRSHFENERELFHKGIKTLSLFFIDKVENYRKYDNEGNEVNSEYGAIFEEEYTRILNEYRTVDDVEYRQYLDDIDASKTHAGYFSIDKKGHKVDSSLKRGSDESDDISAYDLILKDKEKLLSLDNPVRFIFSHSALREGWDNPNVFQICTLKNGSDSGTKKRQEVGRGLRLCVNQTGDRMDKAQLGENVHDINKLTVIASDGYKDFVSKLQEEISEDLYKRPTEVTIEYFEGKSVMVAGERKEITRHQATAIYQYLIRNDYVDEQNHVKDNYKEDADNDALAPLPLDCQDMGAGIHELIQQVYRENTRGQVEITNVDDVVNVELNEENFNKKEFQKLWKSINHKYSYTVDFNSDELIDKAVRHIDQNLRVSRLRYTVTKGAQTESATENDVRSGNSIEVKSVKTEEWGIDSVTDVVYDLVGQIASGTSLTRRTVAKILAKIKPETFAMFEANPEEFIKKTTELINEQKATTFVEHISYNMAEGSYDSDIFTTESHANRRNVKKADKSVQNYVVLDGYADDGQSIEGIFTDDLETHDEVCVYAKLPKGFLIPTPVGSYSPDWAVAFTEGSFKRIFFVAETKGSMSEMNLRPIEKAKIDCAKKLFEDLFSGDNEIKYDVVENYGEMLDIMGATDNS